MKSNLYSYTLEKIKQDLIKKEKIVKSFIAPKFVESEKTRVLIECLKNTIAKEAKANQPLDNVARSVALINSNNTKEKSFSFKDSNFLKTPLESSAQNKSNAIKDNSSYSIPVVSKKYDVITVTEPDALASNRVENNEVFHSYIEKLETITTEIKKISSIKIPVNSKLAEIKTKKEDIVSKSANSFSNIGSNLRTSKIETSFPKKQEDSSITNKTSITSAKNILNNSLYSKENQKNNNSVTKQFDTFKSDRFKSFAQRKSNADDNNFHNLSDSKFRNFNTKDNSVDSNTVKSVFNSKANNHDILSKNVNSSNKLYDKFSYKEIKDKSYLNNVSSKSKEFNNQSNVLRSTNENTLLQELKNIAKDIKESISFNNSLIKNNIDCQKQTLSIENKQKELFNSLFLKLDDKIEVLTQKILPYINDIRQNVLDIIDKNKIEKSTLKDGFTELEKKLEDLKKSCDLNGLDIDSLHDTLNELNLGEALKLLRSTNLHVHSLMVKQEKLNEEESAIVTEVKSLEKKIKHDSTEHFNKLVKQIKDLNEDQKQSFLDNEDNRKKLIEDFKQIVSTKEDKSQNISELQGKLNDLLLRQEDLLKAALNIKSYVVDNNKELTNIKNTDNNKVLGLIEELNSNNKVVVKEQNTFNQKIHNDMELIKKSIIKLVEERQKESSNSKIAEQVSKVRQEVTTSVVSEVKAHNVNNKQANTKDNNKENHKNSQIKMAIGKLREALDLESINTVEDLHKEYLDEIIDDKIHQAVNNNPDAQKNVVTTENKLNESKAITNTKNKIEKQVLQNTFVLDNSKFFK